MPNNELQISDAVVTDHIYSIRNHKVMLDRDLAALYGIETKRSNEQVKRNLSRFPDDFMFQLNDNEFANLKSQFATSSWGGLRKLPFAFTEHGVLMLSSVINSERAIQTNILIMRIFSKFRQMILDTSELKLEIEKLKMKTDIHSKNLKVVFHYLDQLASKEVKLGQRPKIGYKK